MRHTQVLVEWQGRQAEVDEGIAPLVLACWQKGIDTVMSCQDDRPGVVWVMFPSSDDAKRFLDLTDYAYEWKFETHPKDMTAVLPREGAAAQSPTEGAKRGRRVRKGP